MFSGSLLQNDSPSVIVNECWERERGSLSFLLSFLFFSPPPRPSLFLSSVVAPSFPSLASLLCARLFLSLPPSLPVFSEQGAPTSPLPWSCWGGGWERREGGGEKGGGCGGQIIWRSRREAVEFCRLSQLIRCTEPLRCRMNKHYLCPSPARQRGETRVCVCACVLCKCVVCLYC